MQEYIDSFEEKYMYKSLYDIEKLGLSKEYPLYGAILFTKSHPNIIKCLKDDDYWNALSEISGEDFPVFANTLFQGRYEMPSFKSNSIGFMVQVWKEPNQNKEILEWFSLKDSNDPVLVVFGFESETMFQATYKLSDESIQKAFESLKKPIKNTSDMLKELVFPEDTEKLYKKIRLNEKYVKFVNPKNIEGAKSILKILITLGKAIPLIF
jgi:hypothetical protein